MKEESIDGWIIVQYPFTTLALTLILTAVGFITVIQTVKNPVTPPAARNTLFVAALKVKRWTPSSCNKHRHTCPSNATQPPVRINTA